MKNNLCFVKIIAFGISFIYRATLDKGASSFIWIYNLSLYSIISSKLLNNDKTSVGWKSKFEKYKISRRGKLIKMIINVLPNTKKKKIAW